MLDVNCCSHRVPAKDTAAEGKLIDAIDKLIEIVGSIQKQVNFQR